MGETMSQILNPGTVTADPDFPHAPPDWSRETATSVAKADGIELGPDHWEVIGVLQAYFAELDKSNMRELSDALDERFHARGGLKYLYETFPGGPIAQGCRLAGLQPPAGAVDKSFGSVR
jgi:TusE/DsrC/DsvC family sulfur relay protein